MTVFGMLLVLGWVLSTLIGGIFLIRWCAKNLNPRMYDIHLLVPVTVYICLSVWLMAQAIVHFSGGPK